MFDEGGARHGIKTTNFAEVYNVCFVVQDLFL
jgi:hypothetical protein